MPDDRVPSFWTLTGEELLHRLGSERNGLSNSPPAATAAQSRPLTTSLSRLRRRAQCRSPFLLLLLFAATTSALSSEWIDSTIVLPS